MMIKRIEIRNFQAHKKLAVDFEEGVTTIIGPSDTGKSAVIRAIRWAVFNKPGGAAFIREGAARCSVKLFLDSGDTVYREKGKANIYKVNDKTLKAFGAEPPAEVIKLFNLSEINFQNQHDAPYWFSLSAGEVSRQLNKIIDLEIIDKALYNINATIRKAKTNIDVLEDQKTGILSDLEKVETADEMDADLKAIELRYAQCSELTEKAVGMQNTIKAIKSARRTLEIASQGREMGDLALERGRAWDEMRQKYEILRRGVYEIARNVKIIRAAPPKGALEKIETLARVRRETTTQYRVLKTLVGEYEQTKGELCQATERAEKLERERAKVKTCPLCGQKVK